jgi:RNA polymerase sigma-70 factor (ECF subfamily)
MVALRMDARLAARVDPSDIVQEALADAAGKLVDFAATRPMPFDPWLRRLAFERVIQLHRRHVKTQRRSVNRESPLELLSDESALKLAERLASDTCGPVTRALREEIRTLVHDALARLSPSDREVLVLIYLEQLSLGDVAASLDLTLSAVKMRHLRAMKRLKAVLQDEGD